MRKIKLEISNGCLAFLCAYCVFDPYGTFLPFLLSVGAHELGHLLVLRAMGIPIEGIRAALGGTEILTKPLSYRQEILAALTGPGVNLLLLLLTADRYPVMALINGVLLMYNMIPIYPLDGGRILRGTLHLMLPLGLAGIMEKICAGVCLASMFLGAGYLCVAYRCGIWPILLCGFLFYRLAETILPIHKNILDKMEITC